MKKCRKNKIDIKKSEDFDVRMEFDIEVNNFLTFIRIRRKLNVTSLFEEIRLTIRANV